jgi:hypothetical protein
MSTPANQLGIPPPMLDPSQYPSYMDMQRKQQIAQMLVSAMQSQGQAPQMPNTSNPYAVMPRRSPLQSVSQLATALMAGKALGSANQAQKQYFEGLYNPPAPAAAPSPSTGPGAGIISPDAPPDAQAAAQGVTQGAGLVRPTSAAPPPRNPMIPPGMTPGSAQMMMNMMGPEEYAKTFLAPGLTPTEQQRNDAAVGITPAQRRAMSLADALKTVRGSTATLSLDANGNPVTQEVPGLKANIAARTGAETAATAANTPHYEPDPFHPGQFRVTYPTPPGAAPGAPPSGSPPAAAVPSGGGGAASAPQNAASLAGQTAGAQKGLDYQDKINSDAANAIEGKRSLAEMGNLLSGFTPGAGAPVLASLGSVAQALGVPSTTVAKFTNMNVGDVQAFQRSSAALADAAGKQIEDPEARAEFKNYVEKNPSWMMSPDGLKRAMDFMNRGFDAPLEKQQAFASYAKTASPDQWPRQFEAQWNKGEAQKIAQGQYNSAPAALTGLRTSTDVSRGPAAQYTEGQIAHNPQTGAMLVFRGGRWVPK